MVLNPRLNPVPPVVPAGKLIKPSTVPLLRSSCDGWTLAPAGNPVTTACVGLKLALFEVSVMVKE